MSLMRWESVRGAPRLALTPWGRGLLLVVLAALLAVLWIRGKYGQDPGRTEGTAAASGVAYTDLARQAAYADVGKTRLYFEDATPGSGLEVVNHSGSQGVKEFLLEAVGPGIAWIDYDGDGWLDVYVPDGDVYSNYRMGTATDPETGRTRPVLEPKDPRPEPFPDRLLRNRGDGTFEDVTDRAGIADERWSFGVTAFDLEGDGDQDLFVANFGKCRLWRNNGDGTFSDVAEALGVAGDAFTWATCASAGDLDGDGRLDLYVAAYADPAAEMARQIRERGLSPDTPPEAVSGRSCRWRGLLAYCGPIGLAGQHDRCYRQRIDGTFEDVTQEWGLTPPLPQYGFTTAMYDFDGDGLLDIYVANDSVENFMWHQSRDASGKIRFHDRSDTLGVKYGHGLLAQASMGLIVADPDQDGLFDLLVTNFSYDYNNIFNGKRVAGTGSFFFRDRGLKVMGQSVYFDLSWGCGWHDLDNDTDLDLYIANGHVYKEVDHFPQVETSYDQLNALFECIQPERFGYREVGAKGQANAPKEARLDDLDAGPGTAVKKCSRAAAFGDYDNDGRLDVLVGNMNDIPTLLHNQSRPDPGGANWVKILLRQAGPNRDALGAVVQVAAPARTQTFLVLRMTSFLGTNDPRLHVGLGRDEVCDATVTWPGSERVQTVFKGLKAGQLWLLDRESGQAVLQALPSRRAPEPPPEPDQPATEAK